MRNVLDAGAGPLERDQMAFRAAAGAGPIRVHGMMGVGLYCLVVSEPPGSMTPQAHIVVHGARRAPRAGMHVMTAGTGQHLLRRVIALLKPGDLRSMAAFAQEPRRNRHQSVEIVNEKPSASSIAHMKIPGTMTPLARLILMRPRSEGRDVRGVLSVVANKAHIVGHRSAWADILAPLRAERTRRNKDNEARKGEERA